MLQKTQVAPRMVWQTKFRAGVRPEANESKRSALRNIPKDAEYNSTATISSNRTEFYNDSFEVATHDPASPDLGVTRESKVPRLYR